MRAARAGPAPAAVRARRGRAGPSRSVRWGAAGFGSSRARPRCGQGRRGPAGGVRRAVRERGAPCEGDLRWRRLARGRGSAAGWGEDWAGDQQLDGEQSLRAEQTPPGEGTRRSGPGDAVAAWDTGEGPGPAAAPSALSGVAQTNHHYCHHCCCCYPCVPGCSQPE